MSAHDGHSPDPRVRSPRAGEGRLRRAEVFCGRVVARALLLLTLAAASVPRPVAAQEAVLPSGQTVTFLDAHVELQDDGARWLILRYLAPRIAREGGDLGYDDVSPDLDLLCERDGLPASEAAGAIDQVVIVLLDRPVSRGAPDPAATQFISAYLPAPEGCEWQ